MFLTLDCPSRATAPTTGPLACPGSLDFKPPPQPGNVALLSLTGGWLSPGQGDPPPGPCPVPLATFLTLFTVHTLSMYRSQVTIRGVTGVAGGGPASLGSGQSNRVPQDLIQQRLTPQSCRRELGTETPAGQARGPQAADGSWGQRPQQARARRPQTGAGTLLQQPQGFLALQLILQAGVPRTWWHEGTGPALPGTVHLCLAVFKALGVMPRGQPGCSGRGLSRPQVNIRGSPPEERQEDWADAPGKCRNVLL